MYVKFVRDTLRSSLNDTPVETRWTFFTCCLMADWDGWFTSTPSGIAREANLPLAVVIESLETLQAPDPNTTTPGDDGVRVKYHGNNRWFVCNIAKYRASDDIEARRAVDRERQARHRDKSRTEPLPSRDSNVTSRHKDIDKDKELDQEGKENKNKGASPEAGAAPSVKPDPVKEAKKAINRSIQFDPATFTLSGITQADRAQWAGYAPGCNIDAEIAAFLDYMQTHPEALERTVKTGAWKAALNTRFRNVAKYGSKGNIQRVGTPTQERLVHDTPFDIDAALARCRASNPRRQEVENV